MGKKTASKEKEVRQSLPLCAVDAADSVAFSHPKGNKTVYANTVEDFIASGNESMKVIIPEGVNGGTIYSGLKRAAAKASAGVQIKAHKRKAADSILLIKLNVQAQ